MAKRSLGLNLAQMSELCTIPSKLTHFQALKYILLLEIEQEQDL
jgi:hypothetical protein